MTSKFPKILQFSENVFYLTAWGTQKPSEVFNKTHVLYIFTIRKNINCKVALILLLGFVWTLSIEQFLCVGFIYDDDSVDYSHGKSWLGRT